MSNDMGVTWEFTENEIYMERWIYNTEYLISNEYIFSYFHDDTIIYRQRINDMNFNTLILSLNKKVKDRVMVYPNPTKNILNISGSGIYSVEIYSLEGKLLKLTRNVQKVDISMLKNGIYIAILKKNDKHISRIKIIKE